MKSLLEQWGFWCDYAIIHFRGPLSSGNSYVTLSLIYPSIVTLKNNLNESLLRERSASELLIEELEDNEITNKSESKKFWKSFKDALRCIGFKC